MFLIVHQDTTLVYNSMCKKNLEGTLLLFDFSKAFDSIHLGKMDQIQLAYDLLKETVTAIMMIYKSMKAMVLFT